MLFSKKTINTYLKPEVRVLCREVLDSKYIFIVFLKTNQIKINFCTPEILKTCV